MLAKSRWMLGQIPAWVLQTGAARRCRRYGRMRSAGGQCAGATPVGPGASPTRSAGPGGVSRPRRRGRRLQLQPWRPAGTASAGDVTAFAVASTCKVGATRWWTVGQANGWDKAAVQELRGAVYRGDGQAVLAALRERPLESVLQLAGDGLLVALRQQTGGARELAGACLDALRERMAEGDEELAEELAAALGGVVLMRRPVDGGGRLDVESGEIWSAEAEGLDGGEGLGLGEDEPADFEDPDRWLWIDGVGSGAAYRDMVDFAATVTDPVLADRLDVALDGRGAFRRFKDVLDRDPDELSRWHSFSGDRRRGRDREWVAMHALKPALRA